MKLFLFLIGMAAAFILGYSFEPGMRFDLTGKAPAEKKIVPREIVVKTGSPTKKIDPASYSADQLPEKILLHADAEISNEAGDLKMNIPSGSRVNLIRVEGPNVIISPGAGPFEGIVPVSQTDLVEQLMAKDQEPKSEPNLAQNEPMAEPELVPVPVPENTPETTLEQPSGETAAEPEMTEEPTPTAAEPEPVPTTEPAVPDGPVDAVAVMQASIKGGEIKEFTFDQVLDWEASEAPEKVDGESYQTGIASYKAETVFGMKTIQAKALIKGGKVVRWLWPKSGMEIK